MKRFVSVLSIIFVLASFVAATTAPANYAGTWSLDAQKSKNLPPRIFQNVTNLALTVTQDTKKMDVRVHTTFTKGDPQESIQFYSYNFDGSETKAALSMRTPMGMMDTPAKLRAKVLEGGKLELTIDRELNFQGNPVNINTVERWELSADSKTLTVHRTDTSPRGAQEYDMVFNRK